MYLTLHIIIHMIIILAKTLLMLQIMATRWGHLLKIKLTLTLNLTLILNQGIQMNEPVFNWPDAPFSNTHIHTHTRSHSASLSLTL